jgi:hypothetical protein
MVLAAIQRESGRGKSQKTYFLKNITISFVVLEVFSNFAK